MHKAKEERIKEVGNLTPAWEVTFLAICLAVILLGSKIFTNGVEWLGTRLNLAEGVVGSVLAAVGTALPETIVPLIAIFGGSGEERAHIGIGAILGAPFMLSTLAFFIAGLAVILRSKKRFFYPTMNVNLKVVRRDLRYFLFAYTIAILAAFLPNYKAKLVIALSLVAFYILYVFGTTRIGEGLGKSYSLSPLFLAKYNRRPSLKIILFQICFALGLIIFGAHIFVDSVVWLSNYLEVPSFVLALIIAPVATELPEKFNSIIWLDTGKDTLALGNITGAMVFQSSIVPAIGIILTAWDLTLGAMLSAILAILSALVVYIQTGRQRSLTPYMLLIGGIFYILFLGLVLLKVI